MIGGEKRAVREKGETFPGGACNRIDCCRRLKTDALRHTLDGSRPRYRFKHRSLQRCPLKAPPAPATSG